jgi:predicted O-linked N-acetylglucosamine transferase (SPINDLY family)
MQAATLVGQARQALQAGQWDRAGRLAAQALAGEPGAWQAWHVRAIALHSMGRLPEAIEAYGKSIELGNTASPAFAGLALANVHADRLDAALAPAREAVRTAPASAEALRIASHCELHVGDVATAVEGYRRLEELAPPADRWRFIGALAWPAIMESREQIARRLAEVDRALDDLLARPAALADPLREVGFTGFYMAYQGFDDTLLQKKIAEAYRRAAPRLEWQAPHVARARVPGRKIRVGILSRHLTNHTIGKLNIGIAQKLDRERFEVIVMRPPSERDFLAGAFDQCADRSVTLPPDLAGARAKVAEAELDALFYTDIGMDPFTYFLPFARLARVQFTTLGHPVTTGIPNMDYFLSSRHSEPADAQRFYHERLVQFESLPAHFYAPRPPSAFDIRAQMGLGADERLYACTQTLFKVHPDFDDAVVEILRRDAKARVLFISAKRQSWNDTLRRRFERTGADVASRIAFVPPIPLPDYLALLRDADALLDTFHFGGGCSSYEAFAMSAPVVTLPGESMRGRLTAGLYAHMGVSRWIARSAAEFVDLALRLAQDKGQRGEWGREILEGAGRFMDNDAVVREYEAFIEAAVGGSRARD